MRRSSNLTSPTRARCALLFFALFATRGLAQQLGAGTISGTVRDASGAAVSGAKVMLASDENSLPLATVTTGPDGRYSFSSVQDGEYHVTAELPDSHSVSHEQVSLTSRQTEVVDLRVEYPRTSGSGGSAGNPGGKSEAGPRVPAYYEGSQLKPAEFNGSADAGGYSAPGQADRTSRLLKGAVQLKKKSQANPAKSTDAPTAVQKAELARIEMQLQLAVKADPESFEANQNLGEFYIHTGKLPLAIPYLKKAYGLNPSHYVNAYDLALAELETRNFAAAREEIHSMLERQDSAELHDLLAEAEEKSGNYIEAANEYERAAHLEPSEPHIFDWGIELLLHQTLEPALKVFQGGVERYPHSGRMLIGLGLTLYARGQYDEAIKTLSQAADLEPSDPRPYLFLAKMYNVSTVEAPGVTERLRRFVELEPRNAQALYYYSLSLWKGAREQKREADLTEIERLLKNAAGLDPRFADAHLQLGILWAYRKDYPEAIREYQQAIRLEPSLVDAHYRLAQAYVRIGEKERAQGEFDTYARLHNQQQAEKEKQRAEIQQFVYTLQENSTP